MGGKIYTGVGDKGHTRTLGGKKVPKDDCLIVINGDIDALQSSIDRVIAHTRNNKILLEQQRRLLKTQVLLWQLGGEVSQQGIGGFVETPVDVPDIIDLERAIDAFAHKIEGFQRFDNPVAIDVNEARVRTRKLEQALTQYLRDTKVRQVAYQYINRLSDYFFALSVAVQKDGGERSPYGDIHEIKKSLNIIQQRLGDKV